MKNNHLSILVISFLLSSCENKVENNTDWQDVSVNTNTCFTKVEMVNNDVGYVAGRLTHTYIIKKWTDYIASDTNCVSLDSSIPVFSGEIIDTLSTDSCLYKTENGGLSWTPVRLPFSNYMDMSFIDQYIGFILTDNGVYKTVDGCESWQKILSNKVQFSNNEFIGVFEHLKFINEDEGFIYTNHFLSNCLFVKISGNGRKKKVICSSYPTCTETNFQLVCNLIFPKTTQDTGILVSNKKIFLSSDSGSHWKIINDNKILDDMELISNSTWIGTTQGWINQTTDSGISWKGISNTSRNFFILKVMTKDIILASDISDLFISKDAGITFRKMTKPQSFIYDIGISSQNIAVAAGSDGKILIYKDTVNYVK
jgi:photosystem II stability/assembly factor-like uncharacterized protein